MAEPNRSTLLVFTLGPGRERARKRWLGERFAGVETELHRFCLDRVLEAGRALGLGLRVCTPGGGSLAPDAVSDRQAGGGFGERLLGAMGRAWRAGPGRLIVVGTDSPQLDAALLQRTQRALAEDAERVVVGPAEDGGIYLLASSRPLVGVLTEVRWRSRHTLDSLLAALRAAGRPVHLLPVLRDLDQRRDLERWLARTPESRRGARSLIGRLRRALRLLAAVPPALPRPLVEAAWCRVPAGRAPPA